MCVRHTRVVVDYRVEESEPKSRRSRRQVTLDPWTVDAVRRHLAGQQEERRYAGELWQECSLVFVREDGSPYHPERISELFRRCIAASGLPPIRLHDLRHTSATLALRAGVHPKVVQERLGHASISVTLDTYSHVTEGLQQEAATRIASLVAGT